MSMSVVVRRASAPAIFKLDKSQSCPNLPNVPKRNFNLMVMHPRAPKIRHLNASHSLLIELEENVKKVQDLENKVIQLEKQLQWKEIIKKKDTISKEAAASSPVVIVPKNFPALSLSVEEQIAFKQRLEDAKKKAEEVTQRRNEEEAKILQCWNEGKMKQISEEKHKNEANKILLLPTPEEPSMNEVKDVMVANLRPSLQDELSNLQEMLSKRDSLGKLFHEAQEQEVQAKEEVRKLQSSIASVNSMKIKLCGNISLSNKIFNTVKTLESQKKNLNLYVYGPNPIFNNTKELELTYSINNQFIIETLKELDISLHVVQQNLTKAQDARRKFKESKAKIMEALQSLQDNIDTQTQHLNTMQSVKPVKTVQSFKPTTELMPEKRKEHEQHEV